MSDKMIDAIDNQTMESIILQRNNSRRSDVWQFMEHNEESRYVTCKLCGFRLTSSSRSGTSNLRNHLMNRHSDVYRPAKIPDRAKRKYEGCDRDVEDSHPVGLDDALGVDTSDESGWQSQQTTLRSRSCVGDEPAAAGQRRSEQHSNGNTSKGSARLIGIKKEKVGKEPNQNEAKKKAQTNKLATISKDKGNDKTAKRHWCSAPRSRAITNLIFRMVVEDLLPLSVTEGTGLRGLVHGLEPGYDFPSREELEDRLSEKLKEGRQKLGEQISTDEQRIGLTCTLWSDYQSKNYITLTAHIITSEWKSKMWTVGTIQVFENATDQDVAQQIQNLCQECNIPIDSVAGIVFGTDGKQSIPDISERLKILKSICSFLNWECRPCAGEMLEISVQNALSIQPVAELIQATGRLIIHLTINKDLNDNLCKVLKRFKQSATLSMYNCTNGWLSVCDMFVKISEMHKAIMEVLDEKNEHNLTDGQWQLLPELVEALQSIKAAVAVMSDSRNKSGSCWLPVMQGVLQHIQSSDGKEISEEAKAFRDALKRELNIRCELDEILPSSLTMQASVIDPRFHHLRFLSDEDRTPVIDELKKRLVGMPTEEQKGNDSNAQEESPFFKLLGEDEFNKKMVKPEDEIDLFRLERPVSRETDPLNWWRLNEKRFPGLARLARAILCVPAAASPINKTSEKVASLENRRRLEAAHVDAQLFLHTNLELFL
ncbi:E3 SUMO-protein ligase ZBED1-like [Diadema antillarum]|uniref:E3 SUMO-protein ligase ZBED1-like n=1 Tax=Diadema antillarum TaxID=105358 RepID=UPI003A8C1B4E